MKAADLNPPNAVVTPGLIEAAEQGKPGADARALRHCDAWLASGQPLPPALRSWLYERARTIVCDSMIIEEKPL